MKPALIVLLLLSNLWNAAAVFAAAPAIPISDSLVAHSDELSVKMGNQWFGQISKWRIGEYAVVSSKREATHVKTKTNFLKTKSDSTLMSHFSFVLSDDSSHVASVTVTRAFLNRSEHEFKLNKSVGLGSDALIRESDSLGARITVQADTSGDWTLTKSSTIDAEGRLGFDARLDRNERRIVISPVIAEKNRGKSRKASFFSGLTPQLVPPAMGYEFVEEGRSVCAIQTFGGTLKGGRRVVWMHKSLDPSTRLVLAAAITAILQVESSDEGQPASTEE